MYLLFDTETTGLPANWGAPLTDYNNWPRMVQIAWQHYDKWGSLIAEHAYIIKPEGYEIPEEVSNINRVTTFRANKEGLPLSYALKMFLLSLEQTETIIAHNISFDKAIIGAEFLRKGMLDALNTFDSKKQVCTKLSTTNFCKIDNGKGGFKWPKLQELHVKLFNKEFEEAHDALVDVRATAKCFYELKKLNIITL